MTQDVILRVNNLHLSFGGVKALLDVGLSVKREEILAIVGPNGAGKTCLLNCISDFYRPNYGVISFEGREVTGLRAYQLAALERGMGSITGSILGVIFLKFLEVGITIVSPAIAKAFPAIGDQSYASLGQIVFGLVIILFLIFEPRGLVYRLELLKAYYRLYPFSR